MSDKCLHCDNTGYIHTEDDIPDQMCPNCEIGQAVIKGYNKARDIGIQACETLEATKNKQIKRLEAENEKTQKLLQEALPHIECKNNSQSGLITEIGEYLQALEAEKPL